MNETKVVIPMTAVAYEKPVFNEANGLENNEAWPIAAAIAAAAASALGVSAAFVAWVCTQCPGQCRSLNQTIDTVRKWIDGTGC